MKTVLGCIRRADQDFSMLQDGDHVAVGVSGGKDSLLLLKALSLYRLFSHTNFTLEALMLTLGFEPFDTTGVAAFCRQIDVPLTVRKTDIGPIVFEQRQEKNPCALCAKMRRGILNDLAVSHGANKLALGHHREDVLETFLMSLFYEGRLHTFHPATYLSRTGITVVRPMVYLPEKHIVHMARRLDLPIIQSPCPANGHTARQEAKDLLRDLSKTHPNLQTLMLSALRNRAQYGLWDQQRAGGEGMGS
ncbi:MAG: tRNA 2-thiocytidine biosynthesis TtcA family protein [Oscillospiraceae bacterium]|nr:tRNA 2-thiocytidine biosynthesis TtcA family protein [Oscillospiraceae bacterium]